MIYCAMIAGLLAYVTVFPASPVQETRSDAATKATRYEGVIANWNRHRAKDALAQAR